jgi:hypothetical protein
MWLSLGLGSEAKMATGQKRRMTQLLVLGLTAHGFMESKCLLTTHTRLHVEVDGSKVSQQHQKLRQRMVGRVKANQ